MGAPMQLQDKVAVVTGAAGGIGAAIAQALVDAGAHVVVSDLDEARVVATAERLGAIAVAGRDVRDLAAEFGTPAYLVDVDDARRRAREYRAEFARAFEAIGTHCDVFYAGKAFLSVAMAKLVLEEGLHLDVCTGGELAVAQRAGVPGEAIGMHGNNKSVAEIDAAIAAGVGRIVVDSFEEIDRVADAAARAGVRAKVMLRVKTGVEAHTHEFIATAHEDQKFGFSITSGDALEAVRRVVDAPGLDLLGLHSHIGSQIFDVSGFEIAARRLVALHTEVADVHGIAMPEMDLGGGYGIAYTSEHTPLTAGELGSQMAALVDRELKELRDGHPDAPLPRISIEPGRAIAGPSAFTLYEIGTVKDVEVAHDAIRSYVSVDGGMSDNIRTALYDADYTCVLASRESTAAPVPARIVGKHCESGDIVVRDLWLPGDVQPGDLLAVAATGAYCRAMASNYNLLGRPPVVAVRDGACTVMVRRETIDDLLALDAGLAQQSDQTKGGSR